MAKVTVAQFIDLAQKSRIVESKDLLASINGLRDQSDGEVPRDLEAVIHHLTRDGVLTQWQCAKLREGKYRGFFLGKYKLLGLLGSGGMSLVYLAEHTKMHRRVAIKVLPRKLVGDSSHLERFYREARAAAALDHPNIVRAYDIDTNDSGLHYLVMEYVLGSDLKAVAAQTNQPLEIEQVVHYISQAAAGLQHAHQAGLIHRDVKPANLLVDKNDQVKLLDLGLALSHDDAESLTEVHDEKVFGTVDYLAPEQALNSHQVDARVDIYALGCTLYYALVGHAPFPNGTLAQRVYSHQTNDPRSLLELRTDCPRSLAKICERMMRKAPEDRFQTAGEVHDIAVDWLAERSSRWSGTYQVATENATPNANATGTSPAVIVPSNVRPPVVDRSLVIRETDSRVARHRERGRKWRKPSSTPPRQNRDSARQRPSEASNQTPAPPPTAGNAAPNLGSTEIEKRSASPQPGGVEIVTSDQKAVLAARRERERRAKRPPLGLWLILLFMCFVAIGLAVLAAKRGAI